MNSTVILVVDDIPLNRHGIQLCLQRSGLRTIEASDGEEAVRLALEQMPDLILMDIVMPGMTGFEACRVIKADEQTKDIPIVLISGVAQETVLHTGLELGVEEYILKPFTLDELSNRVNIVLMKYGKL